MPEEPATEAWMVVGRRGGKNFMLALIAVYLAAFRDWRPHLAPGEWGTVMVIASDRRQARVTMRYVKGLLENVPMLARLVVRETAESIDLANQITIEVHTASFRSVRGYTVVAALLDEVAFWRSDDESANPDREVVEALRPAMATVPGAILLAASSPYARRGVLWETWQHHYGKDEDPLLVWQADTRTMNPSVPQRTIDAAYERDASAAAAEYGGQFCTDLESYVNREAVQACISVGCLERPPTDGLRYHGFVDPSGGARDSMTAAVAHKEDGVTVLDAVCEIRAPFSPDAATAEVAALLKRFHIATCYGDRFAGEWPRERFRAHAPLGESSTVTYGSDDRGGR